MKSLLSLLLGLILGVGCEKLSSQVSIDAGLADAADHTGGDSGGDPGADQGTQDAGAPDAGNGSDASDDVGSDAGNDAGQDAELDIVNDNDADTDLACQTLYQIKLTWDKAEITGPMLTDVAAEFDNMTYIYTSFPNAGQAVSAFDVPCEDDWLIWGFGWAPVGQQSFLVQVDDGAPKRWTLIGDWAWQWQRGKNNEVGRWSFRLGPTSKAEPHRFIVNGADSLGDYFGGHPNLGWVVFTNDSDWVPSD